MDTNVREQVEEQIRQLSNEELAAVSHFIATLRQTQSLDLPIKIHSFDLLARSGDDTEWRDWLLFAESSLRKDWDNPEEDAAWAHLADLPTW